MLLPGEGFRACSFNLAKMDFRAIEDSQMFVFPKPDGEVQGKENVSMILSTVST